MHTMDQVCLSLKDSLLMHHQQGSISSHHLIPPATPVCAISCVYAGTQACAQAPPSESSAGPEAARVLHGPGSWGPPGEWVGGDE
jgi:hypothetical protein